MSDVIYVRGKAYYVKSFKSQKHGESYRFIPVVPSRKVRFSNHG